MKVLTLTVEEYQQLKRAFAGGFTHANPFYSGQTMENVDSFDKVSSYPYAMLSEKFPMSKPQLIQINNEEEFRRNLKLYCCVFDVKFKNIKQKVIYENYISASHCSVIKNWEENNGRVVCADELITTITEQDYKIIEKFYTWEDMEITNFRRFQKAYLPKDLILAILELYRKKTELKDVIEFAVEYMVSKNMINAVFGMCVTDICRDEIIYDDEWSAEKPDFEKSISKYNKSVKRFLYYAWGIWITAYARKNLFTGIYEFGMDYIYSDTDSLKVINIENHMEYINKYNENVILKLKKMCTFYGIDEYLLHPKNKKGEEKQIGIWEHECHYTRFKTLGAKRYMFEKLNKNGVLEISMTVSGVNKKNAMEYLLSKYSTEEIFDIFNDGLLIPATYIDKGIVKSATGKLTHTYIDDRQTGTITDYLGNKGAYDEFSSVHLENADYSLSLSQIYIDYLFGIRQESL